MIQINDIGLNEYYKRCAARARESAAVAAGEAAKAVHLNLAKLYEEIAAGYVSEIPESWPQQD